METSELNTALDQATTADGTSLAELSRRGPVLVVFLRHAGCAFCREALGDIAGQRAAIEQQGVSIVVVHMSPPADFAPLLARYGLADLAQVSDPEQQLYRAFELHRGGWSQLIGPRVAWRGLRAALLGRHGFNWPTGDVRQLAGVFLIHNGQILRGFRHETAADRPDYRELAQCRLD